MANIVNCRQWKHAKVVRTGSQKKVGGCSRNTGRCPFLVVLNIKVFIIEIHAEIFLTS